MEAVGPRAQMDGEGQRFPPGWYPNQSDAGYRYWDGAHWTDDYLGPGDAVGEPSSHVQTPASSEARSVGLLFGCGVFGILAGAGTLVVALSIPLEPTDVVVASETYIKPAYFVLLMVGGAEVILVGAALAATAVFRPWSTVIPALFAVTFTLGVLMLVGAGAALLGFQTAEIGGTPAALLEVE